MKILFILEKITYGGADKQLSIVINGLSNRHQCSLLTYRLDETERKINKNINYLKLNCEKKGHSVFEMLKTIKQIRKIININHYDVVISFSMPSHIRNVIACIFTSSNSLVTQRSDPYTNKGSTILNTINNIIFCLADMYVFQTKQAQDYYPKKVINKSVVIPNAIEPLIRNSSRIPENRIVCLARLEMKQKRQDILIDAFKMFYKEKKDYVLEFYGDGPDKDFLIEYAKECNNIYFLGVCRNIVDVLENAKINILASDYEGIPNSLLEAMSLGVPCISTRCSPGGAELLIEDNKTGFLVEKGNSFELYKKMIFVANNTEIAEKIGKNGMYVNECYNKDKIVNLWEECISNGIRKNIKSNKE